MIYFSHAYAYCTWHFIKQHKSVCIMSQSYLIYVHCILFTQAFFNSVVMSLYALYGERINGWQDVLDAEIGGNFLLDHRVKGEEVGLYCQSG